MSSVKQRQYEERRNQAIIAHIQHTLGMDYQLPTSQRQFNILFAIKGTGITAQVWDLACQYGDNSPKAMGLISWVLDEVTTKTDVTEPVVTTETDVTLGKVTTETDVTMGKVTTETDVTEPEVGTPDVATSEQAMFDSLPRFPVEDLAKVVAPPTPKSLISKLESRSKPAPVRLSAEDQKAYAEAGASPDDF